MAVAGLSCSPRDLRSSRWHVASLAAAQGSSSLARGRQGLDRGNASVMGSSQSEGWQGPKPEVAPPRDHICVTEAGPRWSLKRGATWQNFSCTLAQPPWFQPKWMKTLTAVGNMKRESEERRGTLSRDPFSVTATPVVSTLLSVCAWLSYFFNKRNLLVY